MIKVDRFNDDIDYIVVVSLKQAGVEFDNDKAMMLKELILIGASEAKGMIKLYDALQILSIDLDKSYHTVEMLLRRYVKEQTNFSGTLNELYTAILDRVFNTLGHEAEPNEHDEIEYTVRLVFGAGYRRKFQVRSAEELMASIDGEEY